MEVAYWSVAQTQALCERRAQHHLMNQGFECYLPMVMQTRVVRNTKIKRTVSLFSRYIFVRIVDQWYNIKSTIGISALLLDHEHKPERLPDAVIDELRKREDKNGIITLPEKERFYLGQQVRVVGGQFDGRIGLYNGMNSKQRERVLLDLLGRSVSVELNIGSCVEAVLPSYSVE